MRKSEKGFTLIELLVVIAVIGVLAGVILASVSSARKKAKDVAIQQSVLEMRKLMELQFSTTGSYTPFFLGDWLPYSGTYNCQNSFSTAVTEYIPNARAICQKIVDTSETPPSWANVRLLITAGNAASSYSIISWLPHRQRFFCLGSNGASSYTTTISDGQGSVWTASGCPTQSPW